MIDGRTVRLAALYAVVVGFVAAGVGWALGSAAATGTAEPRLVALADSLADARRVAAVARARVDTVRDTVRVVRDRWLAVAGAAPTVGTVTASEVQVVIRAGEALRLSCDALELACAAAVSAESTRAAVAESLAAVTARDAGRRVRRAWWWGLAVGGVVGVVSGIP